MPEPAPRRRATVTGVIGELLITGGVVVLLFVGWYLWLGDLIAGGAQNEAGTELSQEWAEQGRPAPGDGPDDGPLIGEPLDPALAPVLDNPSQTAEKFATLHIPRFGEDWVRAIGEGVGLQSVLNRADLGVGHYPETAMPGEVGNFAIAAHRTTYGAPFKQLVDLRVGDRIYVETQDGWYEYAFRALEYVVPTAVDVLAPVPRQVGAEPTERILTMTTCNPLFSAAERAIGYSVMTAWYPREGGAPAELQGIVEAGR